MTYESVKVVDSAVSPGVRFTVAKMSFARRVELMRRVRELARRMEFLEAGESAGDKMDVGLLQAEIDRLYLTWGLRAVSGLEVDAAEATPESLAEAGVKVGLPRDVATLLAAQTTMGAARVVLETGDHPALLKDAVTTPAGCTIDGIMELEEGKLRVTLIKAVVKAVQRAKELAFS